MNKDKVLLQTAARTIKSLRNENELLNARLSGFEDAMLLLKTVPASIGQVMERDVLYDLEKRVTEIEHEEKMEAKPGSRE